MLIEGRSFARRLDLPGAPMVLHVIAKIKGKTYEWWEKLDEVEELPRVADTVVRAFARAAQEAARKDADAT